MARFPYQYSNINGIPRIKARKVTVTADTVDYGFTPDWDRNPFSGLLLVYLTDLPDGTTTTTYHREAYKYGYYGNDGSTMTWSGNEFNGAIDPSASFEVANGGKIMAARNINLNVGSLNNEGAIVAGGDNNQYLTGEAAAESLFNSLVKTSNNTNINVNTLNGINVASGAEIVNFGNGTSSYTNADEGINVAGDVINSSGLLEMINNGQKGINVSGLIKQNSFPCIDEYSRPQRIMIPMNKITLNVLFNFGLVTAGLYLKSLYHSLYPKYDIPKPTIADNDAKGRPYPLIMSHKRLPATAPIVP